MIGVGSPPCESSRCTSAWARGASAARRPLHIGCSSGTPPSFDLHTTAPSPQKHRHRPQRALWPSSEFAVRACSGAPARGHVWQGRVLHLVSQRCRRLDGGTLRAALQWPAHPGACEGRMPIPLGRGEDAGAGEGHAGAGGAGRRPITSPAPASPQAGHPQLPPQALESSLGAWQPDAKRRRVGRGVSGKPGPCLHRPPPALPC